MVLGTAVTAAPTLDELHELRSDYVTPHTAWCPKLEGGPVKTLWISLWRGTVARDIPELRQRFDLTADAAWYDSVTDTDRNDWVGGADGLARLKRLVDAKPYDVVVFNGVAPTLLPAELQYKLLEHVTAGGGVVYLNVADPRVEKHPHDRKPGDPDAALFDMVKGRAARLERPAARPYTLGWEVGYDLWQERLGRAILWAAGRLPAAALPAPAAELERKQTAQPLGTATVRWRLRRDDGGFETPVATSTPTLPVVPAGAYHLDAWNGPGWSSHPLKVSSGRSVTVTPKRDWAEIGESLDGTVHLDGDELPNETLSVELVDRRGRVLARQSRAILNNQATYTFQALAGWPMLLGVRALLSDGAGPAADTISYVNVTQRHRGQFNFLVWDVPNGPAAPWAEAALANLGMTLQLSGGAPPRVVAAYDCSWVPYTTRIQAKLDEQGRLKPVTWNQVPEIDAWVHTIVDPQLASRKHGVFAYSLGDEIDTRGYDASPSDLVAYRHWLFERYYDETLAAWKRRAVLPGQNIARDQADVTREALSRLNRNWGTAFATWDQVTLADAKDPTEAIARTAGQYGRWYDRQAWGSANFLGLAGRFAKAFTALDPQARTGFEGAGRVDQGDDLDGFVRTLGFWSPYPGVGDQVLRSIAPRDFPRANWMGYDKEAEDFIRNYWRMVMNGTDSVWYWRWDGIGQFTGLLRPDLQPSKEIAALVEDTRVARQGLGDLLLKSDIEDDGIGILYSMPSIHAAQLRGGPSLPSPAGEHEAWHRALWSRGYNFRYVTDAQLRSADWQPKGLRVLILPRCEAISDVEALALRQFVLAGGTLVADLRPGCYTEHCVPRETGVLDRIFGVHLNASGLAATATIRLTGTDEGIKLATTLDGQVIDASTQPGGARTLGSALTAAGSTPVFLVQASGNGRAVLLNFAMSPWEAAAPAEARLGTSDWLKQLLDQAGVKPPLRFGSAVAGVRMTRWTNGRATVIGLQRDAATGTIELPITLTDRRYVYDLRTGKNLGESERLNVQLTAGRAQFYALMPRAAPIVRLLCTPMRTRAGSVATVQVSTSDADSAEAVWLTLTRPDGTQADWLRRAVVIDRGATVDIPLPTALNDPQGAWTVSARDLLTGQTVTTKLELQP